MYEVSYCIIFIIAVVLLYRQRKDDKINDILFMSLLLYLVLFSAYHAFMSNEYYYFVSGGLFFGALIFANTMIKGKNNKITSILFVIYLLAIGLYCIYCSNFLMSGLMFILALKIAIEVYNGKYRF